MVGARIIFHAVIILAAAHLLRAAAHGLHAGVLIAALDYVGKGWFTILSLVTSAVMHDQRSMVLATILLVPLAGFPFANIEQFAHAVVPIGAGIALGTALRSATKEWTRDRATTEPVQRDH